MTSLIIDDNKIARSILQELASQVDGITVAGECSTAMEAYNFLKRQPVDLLLLDIEMPGMSGLELTQNLGSARPAIIFTTSKKEYAAEAFELNVVDYIVKPVTPARFLLAMEKAREIIESKKVAIESTEEEFIFIRDSHVVRRLKLDDILYAEAMGDYVKLHTAKKFYAIYTSLKAVEERLPAALFQRVHRSYLVAVNKIDTLQGGVLMVAEHSLPVADAYRKALTQRLRIL
ncbi:LytTR family DNA-binding domain-containing protein [Chitinophaga horti]|uniref:LytTR family DNA-binding domain-containing protein n=1 Tax=Chitinophaga horti TaxID=2920382 RepID=A0ABY6JAY0_9BACT|nr:LytTR family DNA-binding domain-containing protein [Chitinophaga horti]UYQ95474.1 LytTR family DNA-binding domain-containing protein [Chitinophaga horti]